MDFPPLRTKAPAGVEKTQAERYDATGYIVPFPGEKKVRRPSDFKSSARAKTEDDG